MQTGLLKKKAVQISDLFACAFLQKYTECRCVGGLSFALPRSCGSGCEHLLLPFVILLGLTAFIAAFSQTPSCMMILRYGKDNIMSNNGECLSRSLFISNSFKSFKGRTPKQKFYEKKRKTCKAAFHSLQSHMTNCCCFNTIFSLQTNIFTFQSGTTFFSKHVKNLEISLQIAYSIK